MKRRTYLRATGAGCASIVGGCLTRGAPGSQFLIGAYPGAPVASAPTFGAFERWLGTEHAVTTLFVNADLGETMVERFVDEQVAVAWDTGHVPTVTWLPYLGTEAETPADIERRIAAGEYDRFVDRWAARLADWVNGSKDGEARRLYFRPFPEMNGDWLPWSASTPDATPADFVRAWRRVHDRFAAAGAPADRFAWIWNPNVREFGDVRTEAYYPGDRYVDWVGVDGYNWGDSREWSSWASPRDVFEPMVSRLRESTGKPLALPEFGSTSFRDGRYRPAAKARWIERAFDYVQEAGIRMASWFNVDKETDWAVFGGARGTETYDARDGTRYDVYPAYKAAVTREGAIDGGGDGGILTDEQFSGAV